jgi:hypothetical protein
VIDGVDVGLFVDLTEGGVAAAAVADVADQLTVAVGRPVGDVAATTLSALLVRPDDYVAWATPAAPDGEELRGVLARWFGIRAAIST